MNIIVIFVAILLNIDNLFTLKNKNEKMAY